MGSMSSIGELSKQVQYHEEAFHRTIVCSFHQKVVCFENSLGVQNTNECLDPQFQI